jgi:hypothetical protein
MTFDLGAIGNGHRATAGRIGAKLDRQATAGISPLKSPASWGSGRALVHRLLGEREAVICGRRGQARTKPAPYRARTPREGLNEGRFGGAGH